MRSFAVASYRMRIEVTDPAAPAVQHLLAQSDAYMQALYPSASNHLEGIAALKKPNVAFFGYYLGDELVGCGAVKLMREAGSSQSYGEIKRVFVTPAFRGRGISKIIVQRLETYLADQGVKLARLETGIKQPEALGLYRALGYVECTPFGAYLPDPLSVFMEKALD